VSARPSLIAPILAVAAAVGLGAALDAIIKHLGAETPAMMIAFLRFAAGSLVAAGIFAASGLRRINRRQLTFHAGRGLVIVVSATSFFYALTTMPLVEAVVIGFLAPLFVPIVAWALLKERPGTDSLVAAVAGFAGAAFAISGPAGDVSAFPDRGLGAIAAFVAVVAYSLQLVLLRQRAGEDGPALTTLLANVFPALFLAGPALTLYPLPPLTTAPWFAMLGFLGAGLWLLMAWAYARAPAATLAPIEYTALIWTAAFSLVLFDEFPRAQTILGGLVIAGACIWLAWRGSRKTKP
jgi:S-adenosylmethionine uptake transporter